MYMIIFDKATLLKIISPGFYKVDRLLRVCDDTADFINFVIRPRVIGPCTDCLKRNENKL